MRPPCELVQREFLPVFRSELAKTLHARGMYQKQIAAQLEITQAAVSKYLNHPIKPTFGNAAISRAVEEIVKGIMTDSMQQDERIQILCSTCMTLRIGADLCHRHRETVPSLGSVQCKICNNLLGRQNVFVNRIDVLTDMERALEVIENTEEFVRLLPQVRASLVACNREAKTVDQVVGVPGRITDIKGRAIAPMGAEFGASKHTAGILLWAKKRNPETKSCVCIAGGENIVSAAKTVGFQIVHLEHPASEVAEIIHLAEPLLPTTKTNNYGIQVPGGLGIEPVLYLFGSSATNLAKACEKIARLVAKK